MPSKPPTHGYSGRPLSQKLGIKPGSRLCLRQAPETYPKLLSDVWDGLASTSGSVKTADVVHVFCADEKALKRCVANVAPQLQTGSSLWVSWRKGKSAADPSINRETVRSALLATGLVDVKVCAVDADWSGLKFVHRKKS